MTKKKFDAIVISITMTIIYAMLLTGDILIEKEIIPFYCAYIEITAIVVLVVLLLTIVTKHDQKIKENNPSNNEVQGNKIFSELELLVLIEKLKKSKFTNREKEFIISAIKHSDRRLFKRAIQSTKN